MNSQKLDFVCCSNLNDCWFSFCTMYNRHTSVWALHHVRVTGLVFGFIYSAPINYSTISIRMLFFPSVTCSPKPMHLLKVVIFSWGASASVFIFVHPAFMVSVWTFSFPLTWKKLDVIPLCIWVFLPAWVNVRAHVPAQYFPHFVKKQQNLHFFRVLQYENVLISWKCSQYKSHFIFRVQPEKSSKSIPLSPIRRHFTALFTEYFSTYVFYASTIWNPACTQ